MTSPPPRPRTIDELGFDRHPAVRWFAPGILARAGIKVVLSATFGEYLDKRELQQAMPSTIFTEHGEADEVWVDFVADVADGFDATYTVAWCLSQARIRPIGCERELPRGSYLVFGGDQVYPYASPREYESRFVGPYRAALPWTLGDHPRILAIPGNHDWYDGLTSFMRLFAQPGWVGGRQTVQTRSYFAVLLPGRHWLWGIDLQSGAYLDDAQIEYFKAAAIEMRQGDRVILCLAKPSWCDEDDPDANRNLDFVARKLIPDHVPVVLTLSGDKHHYARYVADGDEHRMKITSGGGGAFLSATHVLPPCVEFAVAHPPDTGPTKEDFTRVCEYPSSDVSRRMTPRALGVVARNPSLAVVPIAFYFLVFASIAAGEHVDGEAFGTTARSWSLLDVLAALGHPAALSSVLVLGALLVAFFDQPKRWKKRGGEPADRPCAGRLPPRAVNRWVFGLAHAVAQVAGLVLVVWVTVRVVAWLMEKGFDANSAWRDEGVVLVSTIGILALSVVVAPVILGSYLVVAMRWRRHDTEAFSAFREDNYKNFIRLHVRKDGITVYPIAIDEVMRESMFAPDPHPPTPEASYLKPAAGPIPTRLIEPPIEIPGQSSG